MGTFTSEVIWNNETGFILSNATNIFLEAGGSARTSWVPAKDWTGLTGTRITGEAEASQPNNTIDMFRGYPAFRREHIFEVRVNGADKLFFEWRGEVVSDATGFAIAAPDVARTYYYSKGKCHATGSFVYNDTKTYMREPPPVCYNTTQFGKISSPMAGVSAATNSQPAQVAGGFNLWARPLGSHSWADDTDLRSILGTASSSRIPFDTSSANSGHLTQGGLLWGYYERIGGVDSSRYPKAGDQYGWIYEVGYPEQVNIISPGTVNVASPCAPTVVVGRLCTTGLQRVWATFYESAPITVASGGVLNFTNASMTVRGTITCIRIYDRSPH